MLVRSLDAIRQKDIDEVGGKGANLGELSRNELPVPPGFVVMTAGYRRFVRRYRKKKREKARCRVINAPALSGSSLFFLRYQSMLMGQTMAVFNYNLAVRLGLQESIGQVGEFGAQVNRAFGAGDIVVYIPLIVVSLVGLFLKKRWSLLTTAAVVGVSAYWSVTISCMPGFLPGVPGYSLEPGLEYWLFIGVYIVFGAWGFLYPIFRGDALIR